MGHGEMGGSPGRLRQEIREACLAAGAVAAGFAAAVPVDDDCWQSYLEFAQSDRVAGMDYLRNHLDIRRDPRLLLDGAKTIVTLAFSFCQPKKRPASFPRISAYAGGEDYHDVIRKRLKAAIAPFSATGAGFRICVDTAPIAERYWARKSGLGFIARNGMLVVPGAGNQVFLAEIITTLELEPDRELTTGCLDCGACGKVCPAGALKAGIIDCRDCLSYLTIEHRGPWDSRGVAAMSTRAGKETLYGCDRCVTVCPYSREGDPEKTLPELLFRPEMLTLDAAGARSIDDEAFREMFRRSAVKRCKFEGWQRNAANLGKEVGKNAGDDAG